MTPAETLRAAATKIRDTAAEVEYGAPWDVADDVADLVVSGDLQPYGAPAVAKADFGTAPWIALMSPAVAEPLAAWLELTAEHWRPEKNLPKHYPARHQMQQQAMTVARLVLGEAL